MDPRVNAEPLMGATDGEAARAISEESARVPFGRVTVPCSGGSMRGTLATGDRLQVEEVAFEALQAGDVVAYRMGGRVAAHRIVERRDGGWVTHGDGQARADRVMLSEQDFIGKVVARERRGRVTPVVGGELGLRRARRLHRVAGVRQRVVRAVSPFYTFLFPRRGKKNGVPLSGAVELICACASPDYAAKTAGFFARGGSVDWTIFLELEAIHQVLPLVNRALKPFAERVPSEILRRLQAAQGVVSAHNLRAAGILRRLQKRLEAAGILLVPIKGPGLAILAFGDVGMRQFQDLDVIVRREDLLRAVEVFEQDGYRLIELTPRVDRARFLATLQNWSLGKPGFPTLDLKPVLISHTLSGSETADQAGATCQVLPGAAFLGLRVPSVPTMLLAVCTDGANEMWIKLSQVADVAAMLHGFAGLDWATFLAQAKGLGQLRCVLVGAGLAEALLGAPLPEAFRVGLKKDFRAQRLVLQVAERVRTTAPRHGIVFQQMVFAFWTRERLRDKFRFVWRLLFVPSAYEFTRWNWPRPLAPLYALARPFRLVWTVTVRRGRSVGVTAAQGAR